MKANFKNILLMSGFAASLLTSCYNDDGDVKVLENSANDVVIEATISSTRDFTAPGDLIPFTVMFSQSVDSLSSVGIEARADDTSFINTYFDLPAGATSLSGTVFTPGGNGFSASGIGSINDLIDLEVIGLDSNIEGQQILVNSNDVQLDVFDRLPEANFDAATVLFDWTNPDANDLDLVIFGDGGTLTGFTGDRYEELVLSSDLPDGDYTVQLQFFFANDTPIDYNVFIRLEDGATVEYNGQQTFTDAEVAAGAVNFATITKVSDADGNPSFTVSYL
ncbi:hypothetical protein [Dokdonia sp. R86516]|uniref:hypothetical protein n=1 Tax=Dokdonia sp. R86516 TaxID=3093856 RepID=UPI0037CBEBC8